MSKIKKWGIVLLFALVVAGVVGYYFYGKVYDPNTAFQEDYQIIFIDSDDTYHGLLEKFMHSGLIADIDSFDWVAKKKKYPELMKPGRYRINKGASNNDIINKLRIGDQDPVLVTFTNARVKADLASKLSEPLECDSASIHKLLNSDSVAASYGFSNLQFTTMFLPNTYEMYWNSSAQDVVARMASAYKEFWSADRIAKAQRIGLSQSEVSILASIVKAETSKADEAPSIAGVYLNRIDIGMPLQADPTLVFALGDFSITRVLDRHKQIDSPYNTYKYAGLPPGPINVPSAVYIDAVLNAEKHEYLYFCAKPDFSGYHNFAKSYRQHLVYAKQYQNALNKRRIYR